MAKVFGIDLGTTYSCVAYIDENGKPVVLKNAEGTLTTPSVVYFETDTDVVAGDSAKESAKMEPDKAVSFAKRFIGKPNYTMQVAGQELAPEVVSSYVLKKIVADATDTLRAENKLDADEEVKDVVITCPAYFGTTEREATKNAGIIAGLNVLDIINEPTAAAITYGVTDTTEKRVVLVYDLGGGTFDVTMIEISPDLIQVVCTGGDHELGGKDWDDQIINYLDAEFQEQTGTMDSILTNPETLASLVYDAERAKKLLTSKEKAPIVISHEGERVRVELTRETFDEITAEKLEQTITVTENLLKTIPDGKYTKDDINEILLVGGSAKMPQVMRRLKEAYPTTEIKMFDPDESVAKGAAIFAAKMEFYNRLLQAIAEKEGVDVEEVISTVGGGTAGGPSLDGLLDRAGEEMKVEAAALGGTLRTETVNVTSRSFGIITIDTATNVRSLTHIIMRNTPLPADVTKSFSTAYDNQNDVLLEVFESLSFDDIVPLDVGKKIGEANLDLPKGMPAGHPIEVTFQLGESGLLSMKAKELKENRSIEAQFEIEGGLSEEQLQKAMEDSANATIN